MNEHHDEDAALIMMWTSATSAALRDLDTAAKLPDALRQLAAGEDPAPVVDGNDADADALRDLLVVRIDAGAGD